MLQTIKSYGSTLVKAPGSVLNGARTAWDFMTSGSMTYALTASEIREDIAASPKGSPVRTSHEKRLNILNKEYGM